MQKYTDVIFDFDGTLVDSAPAILATFAQILQEAGITPAAGLDQSLIGPPLIPTLRKISGSDDAQLIDRLAARFKLEYDDRMLPLTIAYPGVAELLPKLRDSGMQLHIATNKRQNPTLRLLDLFGWRALFASVYCIDTPPAGSPDKTAMLARLLAEQGIPRRSAVFVGDTGADGDAAAGNEVAFLPVGWGYGSWPPTPAGPAASFAALVGRLSGEDAGRTAT